jgi:hypothetical protein
MAPTIGALTVASSREQVLYLDFLTGVRGAGDENRTRVLSLGKKGGQPYSGELERMIMAGQKANYTPTNSHERQRPRDIRGIGVIRRQTKRSMFSASAIFATTLSVPDLSRTRSPHSNA